MLLCFHATSNDNTVRGPHIGSEEMGSKEVVEQKNGL